MMAVMAGASLLTLLDDIASILDDVSVMTKTAASKTAGVVGDDLALNAQQVSGVAAKRELPVVWAVGKGSFVNKLILVPTALLISAFAPWLVRPLLMIGGLYLCYEGVEKLVHSLVRWKQKREGFEKVKPGKAEEPELDEKAKIKGAIRTDFVLSAEIIALTLGVVAKHSFPSQVVTMALIAVIMTVGVYGLVACIVKLDDVGLYLSRRTSAAARGVGGAILWAAPFLMKSLSVVGTAAMFLVGGGILTHGIDAAHHWIEHASDAAGGVGEVLIPPVLNGLAGVLAGIAVLAVLSTVKWVRERGMGGV